MVASTSTRAKSRAATRPSQVALIAKPPQTHTGVGRYVQMLVRELQIAGQAARQVSPSLPPLPPALYDGLLRARLDLRAFLLNYPIWASYPPAGTLHITSQNLASLLWVRRPAGRTVVTVHDIIPYMLRNDRQLSPYRTSADRLFDRLAMAGLRRADHLVADSHFTKRCLIEQLGLRPEQITVVYLGIDHERFRPQAVPRAIYERYRLTPGRPYLIYVGSEDPRKNLPTLIRALAAARSDVPDLALIKVGRAHFNAERQRLTDLASSLGVTHAIHWLDDVPEDDLPLLYSLANICVIPSLYEGFGFPVIEAMACGTPVICARAASLPELAGSAGLLFDPGPDAERQISRAISDLLHNHGQAAAHRLAGMAQAAQFRWPHTAEAMIAAYAGDLPG